MKAKLELLSGLSGRIEDIETYLELYREDPDPATLGEACQVLSALQDASARAELSIFMVGEYDAAPAILEIHPGAGGLESCDWAGMLVRMFTRWAEADGYQVEVVDHQPGEAGVKSCTMVIRGEYAYGYLKGEAGVHRLVRISPFDAQARRHTSFASVDVSPEVEEDTEVDLRPEDLKIDVYRSSGAGGQSVNTADSAVRITHLPTGIVVASQNERSQLANKTTCLKVLKSRLVQKKIQEHEERMAKEKGLKLDVAWGSQIRSYVLQPYTMAKDHRTDHEETDVFKVLDGRLGPFIRAYLQHFGGERAKAAAM